MNKPADNPADPFKKALAEATKVMADDPDLTVTYSVDPPGMTNDTLRLPQVKFLKPLLPGQLASVELQGQAPRWRFRVLRGDDLLASGEIVAGSPAP